MWPGEMGDAMIAAREMGEDPTAGGIGQGGERSVQRAGIFNHLVNYLTARSTARKLFLYYLQDPVDRPGRSNNGPRAKRQQRPEK